MNCPSCKKETAPDSFFCRWCSAFIPAPEKGVKAGLFRRYFALALDPFIGIALFFLGLAVAGGATAGTGVGGGILVALLLLGAYVIWCFSLFRKGQTPGKKLLSVQVVRHQTGTIPGFGKMFVREVFGKFISGLFLGFGYFAALSDKNNQAWHDGLAGTVVIKTTGGKKAVPRRQQQQKQQIESGAAVAELPEESSTEASPNVEEAERTMQGDAERPAHVNQQENTSQEGAPGRNERRSSSMENQSPPEDQARSQSPSGDEREEEWMGDEYWEREDEKSE